MVPWIGSTRGNSLAEHDALEVVRVNTINGGRHGYQVACIPSAVKESEKVLGGRAQLRALATAASTPPPRPWLRLCGHSPPLGWRRGFLQLESGNQPPGSRRRPNRISAIFRSAGR